MCFLKHLRLDNSKPFPVYKELSIAKEDLDDFSREGKVGFIQKPKANTYPQ